MQERGCAEGSTSFPSTRGRQPIAGSAVEAGTGLHSRRKKEAALEIRKVPLSQIIPYENNPRRNDKAVDAVAESIRQCGYCAPIVVDENMVVLAGHTRLKALKRLAYSDAEVVIREGLTEEQKKKYRLLDNKTGELAEWDFEKLERELENIDFGGFDFGFDVNAGGDLGLDDVQDDEPDLTPPVTPVTALGDIYQLGRHRLMCGDSTDAFAWSRLMDGEKADMVFTDPPYGVAIGDKNKTLQSVQKAGLIVENIENDTLTEKELYEMLKTAFVNVRENCSEDAVYFVTSPQGGDLGMMMMMMMRDAGLKVRHILTWVKNSPTFSIGRLDYDYQHEPIFYTWTKTHHNFRRGRFRSTIWEVDKPRKCDLHPTMKPVELVANAIMDGTEEGMIVLDAFGGSGTTLIAAEQLNRRCRMMELDPKYCDVIVRRWEEFTGEKAIRLTE